MKKPKALSHRSRANRALRARWIAAVLISICGAVGFGRTIEFSDIDVDRIAVIGPEAPRMSWAAHEHSVGVFTNEAVTLRPDASLLLRVPLEDKIPANSRIVKAEWFARFDPLKVKDPKVYAWRIIGQWGPGVCYKYRTACPAKEEWAAPGARGASSDRADRPSDSAICREGEDVVFNVTEDVELWTSGAARNNGWMFTVEDSVRISASLMGRYRGTWKLRITYEPK